MDVVHKRFYADGTLLHQGEVVDTNNWRNVNKLREQRLISKYKGAAKQCGACGRAFATADALDTHLILDHGMALNKQKVAGE